MSLERGEVRGGAGQTQDTHELMCEDCDPLVLAPEEKRHRPSALSYAEHDPPTANVTLFSRRAWNMADLAVRSWVSASQLPPHWAAILLLPCPNPALVARESAALIITTW